MAAPRTPRSGRAAVALVASVALAACGGKSPGTGAAPLPPIASVTVQPERALLERPVDGIIEAVNQATVSAQTSGRVAQILFDVNDFVPAGAVIMRLRGTEQRAGMQQAEAGLTEARARNAEAQTNFQRIGDMYQRRVVSKAQYDQALANRDAAAARLAAAEAGLTSAREGVGYTEITSPYAGVVTKRLVEVGELVTPGRPLMTGLSLRDLRVSLNVPQSVVAAVRRIGKAAIYVGDRRIEASHITIFPEAAAPSSTFRARIDLPPNAAELSPGMYVKVGLAIGDTERLLVPRSSLVERSEVTAVYVVDAQNRTELRYVRTGHLFGDRIEILAGLSPGERVATDPVAAGARRSAPGSKS
jgi:RND family efflux transporter MFP subunit